MVLYILGIIASAACGGVAYLLWRQAKLEDAILETLRRLKRQQPSMTVVFEQKEKPAVSTSHNEHK